ncbi:hypothetical protein [Clostridium beijerinckii]|uniref:hypothetical protein n=1 Tax=Clostridium beijerinckii TaxID=1520 RepID=UPI00098CE4EA|nr:hypothetical protein [Clostridium beijerinckii]MBA8937241.1 hypothetical protein [Clostridium beijerinckii]NRU40293.1 hypothetical protein [Clostridium beijerinckii]NSA96430.1 hypothetical protein [Clostridium beijerinckii]OOM60663.1 hypothetical protein CLOBI_29510 [Clostridium beijerinckii]OOM68585.1 hypothetical protein CLBEIC_32420 [Clostridium beijerinckii]
MGKVNNSLKKEKNTPMNVNKTIEKTAMETAKAIVAELRVQNMIKKELSYYKKVELLLYNYENLKDAIKQKDEEIRHIERYGLPQASGSIVVYQTSGGGISPEDRYLQLIDKYKVEKIETQRDLIRIENALDKIREDKYFDIIQFKYLNLQKDKLETDEKIAERLDKDQSTVTRNRKRLMNKLITILFPESIRELA